MSADRLSSSKSEELYRRACQVAPGGVNSSTRSTAPHLVFQRAEGATLTDADGNTYIDYLGAFGPALLGHNHPAVRRRVIQELESGVLMGAGTTELEIAVAEKIHQHVPSAEKVLLTNSGSEATFQALRVARASTGRSAIIKFQGCYHGTHDAVIANVASAADKIGKLDPASAGIVPGALGHTLVCAFNDLDDVERTLESRRGEVAAIILEPVAHNVGCILPRPGFLQGLRALATAHGALLIFDEVITGFRHHLGGYQTVAQVTPDLTTLGKAIANGFPLAAVCGKAEVMDHFSTRAGGRAYFAGTYNGNVAGCAAALATLDVLEREPVHEHVFRLGERLRRGLREIHQRLGVAATVEGFGSIFVTYFQDGPIESYADLVRNDAARFVEYRRRLIERGIFELPLNLKRNHVSYSHTDAHVDRTLEVSEDVLKQMFGAPGRAGAASRTFA